MLGTDADESKVELLIGSALAFINGYTFRDYSLDDVESIPTDICSLIIEMVCNKYHYKTWVVSEKLSDYSITYSTSDLTSEMYIPLQRYRIYHVE